MPLRRGKSTLRPVRSAFAERLYGPPMAASEMGRYLAQVAREAREQAGRKPYHIASTPPGMKGLDPSTIWRFEQGESWPQDADQVIDLYAADLDIEPIELWARALELWRADEAGASLPSAPSVASTAPLPPGAVAGDVAPLAGQSESPPPPARPGRASRRAVSRRKSA
jgi:hypothetical protein